MAETRRCGIPFTESLQVKPQVPRPVRIFRVMDTSTTRRKARRLSFVVVVVASLVVPAAHAAEPSVTPKTASQWCKAWKAGSETAKLVELYPGSTGFAATFVTKTGAGLDKKNLLGRCVSLTAKKLLAAKRAAALGLAAEKLQARCRAELAKASPAYTKLGRCVADRGRLLQP